jgi:tripartite-type tricarboxylate transporter receptor subunit TctC
MLSRRNLLQSAVLACTSLPVASSTLFGQASDYPSRAIHSICFTPPGTGADLFVRFYSRRLQELAGNTVIVENKPGAFGNIATEYVARSKPDGYTIYIAAGSAQLAAAPSVYRSLNYDPINDFDHITTLSKLPFILVVAGDSPYKTVADLVVYLRQQGDKASYSSAGNTGLVGSELFKQHFGLNTVEVKYKDPIGAVTDVWNGVVAFTHVDPVTGAAHIKSGKLRALATTATERFVSLPNIPSAHEAGITNTNLVAWWSVHTPKGTPQPILDKLEAWFNIIAVEDATKAFLGNLGSDPFPGNSKMLKELLVQETKAWMEYVKLAKIEPVG